MTQGTERPLDDEALDSATAHYARPRDEERRPSGSVLVFRIGAEWLALPTALFDRVADLIPVHSLPHGRGSLTPGLVTVGGDLIVHLSLAALLGVDAGALAPAGGGPARPLVRRLVVLADARGRLAFTADEVWGVQEYDAAHLRPVPSTLARSVVSYATAILTVEGWQVGVLDGPRVMSALSAAIA